MALRPIDLTQPLEEIQWLAEGLIPCGSPTLIAAQSGVNKTSLMVHLAHELTFREGRFLGRKLPGPASSIDVDFDAPSGEGRSVRHALDPLRTARATTSSLHKVHVVEPENALCGLLPDDLGQLLHTATLHCARLIIVDSFMAAFSGVDNNRGEKVMEPRRRLLEFAATSNTALVVIDRVSKANGGPTDEERGLRGSQVKQAQCRSAHVLRRVTGDGSEIICWTCTRRNYAKPAPAFGIPRIQEGGTLRFETVEPAVKEESPKRQQACEAMWQLLQANPARDVTRLELVQGGKATGVSECTAESALEQLLKEHSEIVELTGLRRGAPKVYSYRPVRPPGTLPEPESGVSLDELLQETHVCPF